MRRLLSKAEHTCQKPLGHRPERNALCVDPFPGVIMQAPHAGPLAATTRFQTDAAEVQEWHADRKRAMYKIPTPTCTVQRDTAVRQLQSDTTGGRFKHKTTHLIQHCTHPGFKSCHCLNYSNSGRRQCTGSQAKPRVTDSAATSNMNHALASHCHKHSVLNALVHMQLSPAEVQPTWSLMCQRDISTQFMTPAALDPQTCLTAAGRK